MRRLSRLPGLFLACLYLSPVLWAWEIVHHDLEVFLEPATGSLQATDTITCRHAAIDKPLLFALRRELALQLLTPGWKLEKLGNLSASSAGINSYFPNFSQLVPLEGYRLTPEAAIASEQTQLRFAYSGVLTDPPRSQGEEYSRAFAETPGTIVQEGVYLAGATFWYPRLEGELVSYRLTAHAPSSWYLVSQGTQRQEHVDKNERASVWDCSDNMEEIYLVGGPLFVYHQMAGQVKALVYLRSQDDKLARQYLQATMTYLQMYSQLLGQYPFDKFALVENFWETGYGMPSFTLLGPKIIRFPFIIKSSYPHEILHNWWGNGVFVDYTKGNWCEGLTAYLADHLMKEAQGEGAAYRHQVLQKYKSFVHSQDDFALTQFQARHSQATEAVGYGKCLMLFHELRMRLGDELFVQGLREFYKKFRLRKANFSDIATVFSEVCGKNLAKFFAERIERTGAPQIRLSGIQKRKAGTKWVLLFTLEQTTSTAAPPYDLEIPIAITLAHRDTVFTIKLPLTESSRAITLALDDEPLRLDIDPEFDLFRKLDVTEIPPSIGQILGAQSLSFVVSSSSTAGRQEQLQQFAKAWSAGRQPIAILAASSLEKLPATSALWLMGSDPSWDSNLKKWFSFYGVTWNEKTLSLAGQELALDKTIVLTAAHPENPELAIGWILGNLGTGLDGVFRKLPHYGKYSYLAFSGPEATNIAKGQWPILQSALSFGFGDKMPVSGKLPGRAPLATIK